MARLLLIYTLKIKKPPAKEQEKWQQKVRKIEEAG